MIEVRFNKNKKSQTYSNAKINFFISASNKFMGQFYQLFDAKTKCASRLQWQNNIIQFHKGTMWKGVETILFGKNPLFLQVLIFTL